MEIIQSTAQAATQLDSRSGLAIAIGNFDGVHLGHQEIFRQLVARAAELNVPSGVLTFEPHPARVLAPDLAPPLIMTTTRKLELIEQAGVEIAVVEPFTSELAALSPEDFVRRILVDGLHARVVCVGYDFTFGCKRSGTTQTLAELGGEHGFSLMVAPQFSVDGLVCASTKVREFVLEGRMRAAAVLLGRPFELSGSVVRGAGRGRQIGVPTANLQTRSELLPRGGVYASWASTAQKQRIQAVVNVGTSPTFKPDSQQVTVEAHLLGFSGDLYGQTLDLELVERLRNERRFEGPEELVSQIEVDVRAARARLQEGAP